MAEPAEAAPEALSKYRLLGKLAQGGMAELFLARTAGLGGFERLLVIKRPRPELARDTEFVRMLLDEARIAATLSHSNIVQVFDVDMVDGNVFFAMEHLHGQHVASAMNRASARGTKIPLENAIAIVARVAAGLHYAHERWGADGNSLGIVHRDVAPSNVIVTYDGNVKLIDFGIAKAKGNLSSTRFGLFKGKLPYASPEQVQCKPVDRRTDVYSLGVMLYELTTGFPLFVADNEFELLQLMSEAIVPRPRLRDKSYPRELEQIVLKALARDPDERYATADAMQRDLEMFASTRLLDLSAFSLARLMASLFGDELGNWQTDQRAGLSLEQHITRRTGLYPVPAPSPEPQSESQSGSDSDPDPAPDIDVLEAPTVRGHHKPRWSRSRVAAIVVALVATGVLGGVIDRAWRDDPSPPVSPSSPPEPQVQPAPLPAPIATTVDSTEPALAPTLAPPEPSTSPPPAAKKRTTKRASSHAPARPSRPAPAATQPSPTQLSPTQLSPPQPSAPDQSTLDDIHPRATP